MLYSSDYQYQLFKIFTLENFAVEESWWCSDTIQVSHVAPGENYLPTPGLGALVSPLFNYCRSELNELNAAVLRMQNVFSSDVVYEPGLTLGSRISGDPIRQGIRKFLKVK